MLNKLTLAAAAFAAISFASNTAEAAPHWNLSPEIGNVNGYCNGTGITTKVGYYGETRPRTGDNPDSALVVTVTAGCGSVTAVPSFNLPAGVVQDTSQPVLCLRTKNGQTLSNPPTACANTPIANNWGVPNVYGWSLLSSGETLEVYMPILYTRRSAMSTFTAVIYNDFSQLGPTINFAIDYLPRFSGFSVVNSNDSKLADISFRLDHFHESAQVFVDYGTSPSFGSSTGPLFTDPQWTYYSNFRMPQIGGLASNTTYYYRVRLVTALGTYYSDTQSFITYAQLQPMPNPNLPIYECRFVRCGFGR